VLSIADKPSSLIALLEPHIRPRLGRLTLAFLIGIAIAGLGALQPLLTRAVIDDGLVARDYAGLVRACGAILLLALTSLLLGAAHRRLYVRVSGEVLFDLRSRVYAHLLAVAPRTLERQSVGDLVSRLDGDIAEVQRFGTDAVAAAVSGLLGLLAAVAVMLTLSIPLTLLVLALLPLQLVIREYARPRITTAAREVREQAGTVGAFLVETITGARYVVGAAAERHERARLERLQGRYLERVMYQQLLGYSVGGVSALVGHLATAGTFLVGGWLALHGHLTIGTLIAFVSFLGRGTGAAGSVLGLYTGYQKSRVSLARVQYLLDLPMVAEAVEPIRLPTRLIDITLRGVVVRRADGSAVLDGLDLTLTSGARLFIAGNSGAGKSTLADLLRRFLEPDEGQIELDGLPLSAYRLDELRQRVIVLEQLPWLLKGTLWDNLIYGYPHVQAAAAHEAARRTGLDEVAAALPDGYQTLLGERGAGLSSGQRQRVAIARLLLADPLVIVLDEAINALDPKSRKGLEQAIDDHFSDRIRIYISHVESAGNNRVSLRLEAGRMTPDPVAT
jgi:ATP-binding cassette subfamily B protein